MYYYNDLALEISRRKKSRNIAIGVHILLFLLIWFYKLPEKNMEDMEDKPPYAVKVDFTFKESSMSKLAHSDSGRQRAKAEAAPPAQEEPQEEKPTEEVVKPQEIEITKPEQIEITKPDIKIPSPVPVPRNDEVIETKTPVEEAPVKVSAPKPTPTPTPTKTPSSTSTSSSTTKTTSKTSGSGTTGTAPGKSSTIDGSKTGTGKGDSGDGAGKSKGNDDDAGEGKSGSGTGAYDGSGNGVFGRKIIFRDLSATKQAINETGKVVTKICINRAGIVTYVELNNRETTIRGREALRAYLKAARGYKFQPDPTAPKEQCGKLSFIVDNTVNNKLIGN